MVANNEGETIDTANTQCVGVVDYNVVVLAPKLKMTKEEAILHAAWLVILAGETNLKQFIKVFEACLNS